MNLEPSAARAMASLRRRLVPRAPQEWCELCGAELAAEHAHLLDPAARRVACACAACAILFDAQEAGRYRRIPRRAEYHPDFRLTDLQWQALGVPIGLAFFLHSTPAGGVAAVYPSPAGATDALPPPEAWQEVVEQNPGLGKLRPDVEALLVNRVAPARDHFLVGIDWCFRLIGLLRTHWSGFSGGQAAWDEIARFFDELKRRSEGAGHA